MFRLINSLPMICFVIRFLKVAVNFYYSRLPFIRSLTKLYLYTLLSGLYLPNIFVELRTQIYSEGKKELETAIYIEQYSSTAINIMKN